MPHTTPVLPPSVPATRTVSFPASEADTAPRLSVPDRIRLAERELARRQAAAVRPPSPRASDLGRVPYLALRRAALRGSAPHAAELGFRLYRGDGVPADPERAARWLRIAASRGDARACGLLGVITVEGTTPGLEKDRARGLQLLRLSAVAGSSKAQMHLGLLLRTAGDADDAAEALHWLRIAADCEPEAARELTRLRLGDDVVDDDTEGA